VDEQAAEVGGGDAWLVVEHCSDQFDALGDRKQAGLRLRAAVGDGYNDTVDEAERSPHDVLVPARDRIERAGVDGDSLGHCGAVMKVMAVSPYLRVRASAATGSASFA